MATISLTLDTRSPKKDTSYPIKIQIGHKGKAARISLNVYVLANQWDNASRKVVRHPQKDGINSFLLQELATIENLMRQLQINGELKGCTAVQIKNKIVALLHPGKKEADTFATWYKNFANRHENARTRAIYFATWTQIQNYDKAAAKLTFEDITKSWLEGFFAFMAKSSPGINARNIHLRNIRAVFNDAIDNEKTDKYPFRRLKIRPVATAKRNLKPQALKKLFNAPVEDWQQKYIDIFKLLFLLIGINIGDLLDLPAGADKSGRIIFNRKKTHRLYSIKVEPEAKEIIDKYRGATYLLNVADGCSSYRHFAARLNNNLRAIAPSVTTYWARHSWATIAASLDIPDATISLALGHAATNATTSIYIERDLRKVDEANRRVIDLVLYGKK